MNITVGLHTFEQVKQCIYLGSILEKMAIAKSTLEEELHWQKRPFKS